MGDLRQTIRDDDSQGRAVDVYQRFVARSGETPQIVGQTRDTTDPLAPEADQTLPRLDDEPGLALPGDASEPGRYAIVARLGRGGGGEVFAAEDRRLRRRVAAKVAHGSLAADAGRMGRFAAEAQITASLEHPSILPVYDLGRTPDGRLFFTMREASGRALSELIDDLEGGALPDPVAGWGDRVEVVVRVCEAIAYAHSHGVVHRDIKPSNILLGSFGEVLVVDWGTAARIGTATAGRAVGTPLYMAPEQARGEAADERSDVYALGATLWQLLTLHLPLEDEDPERFWVRKRAGELDPAPATPAPAPAHLLEIARRALSADPTGRWADAAALRDALREWLRNQESLAAAEQARRDLAACGADARHGDFDRAVQGFRRALGLWPGNAEARTGLSLALAAHGRFAIAHGDLDLAGQLLDPADPGHAGLLAELAAAQAQRERQRRRLRWLWPLAALALLAVLLAAGHAWHQARQGQGRWHAVFDRRLDAPGAIADLGWTVEDVHRPSPLPAPVDGAVLLDSNQQVWLPGVDVRGDVRVTVDMQWSERVDGFEMLVGVPRINPPAFWQVPPGFSCQFGGWSGRETFIGVNLETGPISHLPPVQVAFDTGRWYRLSFEVVGDLIRLEVDGREVRRHRQILPVGDRSYRHVAIRSWGVPVRIGRILVERLALPRRARPTVAGDALAAAGNLEDAVRAYLEVADADPRGDAAEEALAKAYIAAIRTADRDGRANAIRERLLAGFPHSVYRRDLQAASALVDWRARRWEEALTAVAELQAANPGDTTAQSLLDQRPDGIPPAMAHRLLTIIGGGPPIARLDISGLGIEDLSPLAGLQLVHLEARANCIRDLRPLAGMPLRLLNIGANDIEDLSPLARSPIQDLHLDLNPVADLSPLRGLPLAALNLSGTRVADLAPLRGMGLGSLLLHRTPVADLGPLSGMATLQRLGAVDTRIADLSPLAACPGLEHLVIAGSPVSDLRPLARLKLRDLDLARTAVTDLTPLAGKRLPGLDLADTPLSDVRLIPEDALTASGKLVLGSAVVDLSPLAGRRLGEIGLSGFRGASLEPLRQVQADSVLLRGIGRQDISPLFDMSGLHYARVFASDVAGTQIDALADLLAGRGMREQDVRCLRAQAALADRDWRRLRELARPAGRALRLKLGIHLGLAEARRLAAEAGAHLPCLVDEADRQALADLMAGGIIFWIGLDHDAGQPDGLRWDDGHPDPRPRRWLQRGVRPQDAAGFNLFSTFGGHQLGMVGRRELESARLDVVLEWPLAP